MTVPEKRVLVAQIMIFRYRRFSATTPKNNSRDKTFLCLSQRYLPLFAYTHAIPEVILQATFSRTVISLSKQKRMNAHGPNSTSYFDDATSGAFYS